MTIETLNMTSLAASTMYVSMTFSRFGNTRRADVEMTTNAVESRFSHSKKLLISPELTAITKADNGIRDMVDALCLPNKRELAGLRMAPNKNVPAIARLLKEYKETTRLELIAALVNVYPIQLEDAKTELKEHFNPAHFPTVAELADEFSFEYAFINFGVPTQLSAISPELFEEETEKQRTNFKNAIAVASETILETFATLVVKLNDGLNGTSSLDGSKKNLSPSHFTKLQEFIQGFEAMSEFTSPALKIEVDKMRLLLTGVDINKVRESDNLKTELKTKVGQAAETMLSQTTIKGRMFRRPEPKPQPETVSEPIGSSLALPYEDSDDESDAQPD